MQRTIALTENTKSPVLDLSTLPATPPEYLREVDTGNGEGEPVQPASTDRQRADWLSSLRAAVGRRGQRRIAGLSGAGCSEQARPPQQTEWLVAPDGMPAIVRSRGRCGEPYATHAATSR